MSVSFSDFFFFVFELLFSTFSKKIIRPLIHYSLLQFDFMKKYAYIAEILLAIKLPDN